MGEQLIAALKDVSLSIEKNEYVALMGPSGSGKTTLLDVITTMMKPTSGHVFIEGVDTTKMSNTELASFRGKKIGFIFQTFNLLPRYSALENVMLPLIYAGVGKTKREEIATSHLVNVGLEDRMEHKPNELSGGQRQRVAVARALVNTPSILLADEPTGNLDSKTSEEIMKLFAEIHSHGNTIILVTHEEDIARHAYRIIKLKDGVVEHDYVNPNPIY